MPKKKICDEKLQVPMPTWMREAIEKKATSRGEYMATYVKNLIRKDLTIEEVE